MTNTYRKLINLFNFFILLTLFSYNLISQESRLFDKPFNLKVDFNMDFKDLQKNTNDTSFIKTVINYSVDGGEMLSIPTKIRARGNFRRKICYFKPMKIKIKKKDAENTIFKGARTLKLVVPCQNESGNNELVYKEIMCYEMFEKLSKIHLKTQPVELTIHETKGKKIIDHNIFGFLIEDDDKLAKRHDAKKYPSNRRVSPLSISDSSAVNFAIFEYMIGNTDWSMVYQHNVEMLYLNSAAFAIPYDFDHSGIVNAYYAKPNPMLNIRSVRDRIYRGMCRKDPLIFEKMRQYYVSKIDDVSSVLEKYKGKISDKEYTRIDEYLGEFFEIVNSKELFDKNISSKCR